MKSQPKYVPSRFTDQREWLSIAEAADSVHIPYQNLAIAIRRGELPAAAIGSAHATAKSPRLIHRVELAEFVERYYAA